MMTETKAKTGMDLAVDKAGSQSNLARHLGVTVQAVNQWVNRGWCPVERALDIEDLYAVDRRLLVKPALRELLAPKPD